MKRIPTVAAMVAVVSVLAAGIAWAEDKKPPQQIVFEAKPGAVTFDHAKHVAAAKNDCKTCHPGVFPQEKAALNYKEGMHQKAEAAKASCAACHRPDGPAFGTKGNCAKCHAKKV